MRFFFMGCFNGLAVYFTLGPVTGFAVFFFPSLCSLSRQHGYILPIHKSSTLLFSLKALHNVCIGDETGNI